MYDNDPQTHLIIGAAIKVVKELHRGMLESVYVTCLAHELKKLGMEVERQKPVPIIYDGIQFEVGFRLDLLVERSVIVEAKAVSATLPVHEAQLLTYMRMSKVNKGLLMNFYASPFTKGIKGWSSKYPAVLGAHLCPIGAPL